MQSRGNLAKHQRPNSCMNEDTTDSALANYGSATPVSVDVMEGDVTRKRRLSFTSMEISQQIFYVQDLLAQGHRPNIIRQMCAEKYGLACKTSEHRISCARRQAIADINSCDRSEMVSTLVERLDTVIQQAISNNMGSNAIGAMRLQAELLQLTAKNRLG